MQLLDLLVELAHFFLEDAETVVVRLGGLVLLAELLDTALGIRESLG